MAQTSCSAMEPWMRTPIRGSRIETKTYGDQISPHHYNFSVLERDNSCNVGASHPHLSHQTPRLHVAHTYDYFPLSHPLSVSDRDELDTHPSYSYSHFPAEREPSDDRPSYMGLSSPQPPEPYSPWGSDSFHASPGLPLNTTCDISPPAFHQSTLDPTVYSNSPSCQSSWSIGEVQYPMEEALPAPSIYDQPAFPLPTSTSFPHPNLDNTSEPTSDNWYPCLWTDGGVVCNAMVQATRSYMNRHLHAYHGFGGSDARSTRCYWTGCGAGMQQGSIARHMVTCHLQAKVTCPMCSKKLSRQDVISKHQRVCPAAGSWR